VNDNTSAKEGREVLVIEDQNRHVLILPDGEADVKDVRGSEDAEAFEAKSRSELPK